MALNQLQSNKQGLEMTGTYCREILGVGPGYLLRLASSGLRQGEFGEHPGTHKVRAPLREGPWWPWGSRRLHDAL